MICTCKGGSLERPAQERRDVDQIDVRRSAITLRIDLNPKPHTLHPTPYIRHPTPWTMTTQQYTVNHKPLTINTEHWVEVIRTCKGGPLERAAQERRDVDQIDVRRSAPSPQISIDVRATDKC